MAKGPEPGALDFLTSRMGGMLVGADALISIPPDSEGYDEGMATELADNIAVVEPGDLIFTKTPGKFYAFMRTLAGEPFDHLAIVLNAKQALHIGPHRVRPLALPLLLDPLRQPMVFRPGFSSEAERTSYLAHCKRFLGCKYDTLRVYRFVFSLAAKNVAEIELPLSTVPDDAKRWICTDAVWQALMKNSSTFKTAVSEESLRSTLDNTNICAPSMTDFMRIKDASAALSEVPLPIQDTSRTRAIPGAKSPLEAVADVVNSLIPDNLRDNYGNLRPEARTLLTMLMSYVFYRLFRRYVFTAKPPPEESETTDGEKPRSKL